ncbi:hypothetical protein Fot_30837 [Forsythia ovata]|uniref:Uncharacterized protein n=1 Tax=Forsythia ovata TaxID=205694 RepID=A0ABD1T3C2_9LAMI
MERLVPNICLSKSRLSIDCRQLLQLHYQLITTGLHHHRCSTLLSLLQLYLSNHCYVVKLGMDCNANILNSLVSFYMGYVNLMNYADVLFEIYSSSTYILKMQLAA